MDERLKELLVKLGNAINRALTEDPEIKELESASEELGYGINIVNELTIGYWKLPDDESAGITPDRQPAEPAQPKFKTTNQDHKFLRALKIAVDEEGQS